MMMIHKVQIATPGEIQRNAKIRKEQDECCNKILLCIGWSLCLLMFIYTIVLAIITSIWRYEYNSKYDSTSLELEVDDGGSY